MSKVEDLEEAELRSGGWEGRGKVETNYAKAQWSEGGSQKLG